MATHAIETAGHAGAEATPPRLENGDVLTRNEFERRYAAMPGVKKAELIEGIVYLPSPVSEHHGKPHLTLAGWVAAYIAATPGVSGSDNTTVRLDQENEYQPDLYLRIDPRLGGQTKSSPEAYVEGAPELVIEIASSSVSYYLHIKLRAYQRNSVREYLVCRALDQEVDWSVLHEGRFDPMSPDDNGILKSQVFPGLWLDRAAVSRNDMATLFAVLRRGLDSPEHSDFVRRLAVHG